MEAATTIAPSLRIGMATAQKTCLQDMYLQYFHTFFMLSTLHNPV